MTLSKDRNKDNEVKKYIKLIIKKLDPIVNIIKNDEIDNLDSSMIDKINKILAKSKKYQKGCKSQMFRITYFFKFQN